MRGINVHDHGALGDWSGWDDDGVAKAFDRSRRTGRPLVFPPGRYKMHDPTVWDFSEIAQRGLTIQGAGGGRSILEWPSLSAGDIACRLRATADWYDLAMAGVSFRSSHAGPTLAFGNDDFSDPLNVAELRSVVVLNSCMDDDATAIRLNYVVNSTFINTRGNAYANGLGVNRGTGLECRRARFNLFAGGSYGNARYGVRFKDSVNTGNVLECVDFENVDWCASNEQANSGNNTIIGGRMSLWQVAALKATGGLPVTIMAINVDLEDDDGDPIIDPTDYAGLRCLDGRDVTTPSLPASTVAVANKTGKNVQVAMWGGTVSAMTINGFTIGAATPCVPLRAGESIALAYTSPPSWWWRPAE